MQNHVTFWDTSIWNSPIVQATMPRPPSSQYEPVLRMNVQPFPHGLNQSVFSHRVDSTRIAIASNDAVTAVAATGGLLWVGTANGRLIRHDTVTNTADEVRGRLGGRFDNAVWRIYADPYSRGALVILKNADGYHAHSTGPVRPRWLAKLRGSRCVCSTWIRVPRKGGKKPDAAVALLGTAFGAVFSLEIDEKYEKDDTLAKLWAAPNGERIDGLRVEQVAGKFIGTVATTSALYLFSDALSLSELFNDEHMAVVNRTPDSIAKPGVADENTVTNSGSGEELLPSELQFMTGNSGVASRRFVWAATAGVMHAQLAVKRRRNDNPTKAPSGSPRPTKSTVIASVQDMDLISWMRLKETSGSAVPLAFNLSAFHVLVLYPGSVYAFNQISGQLTQRITVWSPTGSTSSSEKKSSDWPISSARKRGSPPSSELSSSGTRSARDNGKRVGSGWDDQAGGGEVLSSPAAGFARDVLKDALWIYTEDGEFSRLTASNEEHTEAWKAAKAMNRFDLAMALVSNGMLDDTAMVQTREAVLEAQADHAAAEGNWDVAAQQYAKTNRPVESVILKIVDAYSGKDKPESTSGEQSAKTSMPLLKALGVGSRLEMLKHIKTYLIRKLDRMESSKPMQRTIFATMLVQLYATHLSSEMDEELREEVRKDFGHFLADRHGDLDTSTAVSILNRNGCYEEAWKLTVLSGDISQASDISSRRGQIVQSLSLLKDSKVNSDRDKMSQLISNLSTNLIPQAPHKVSSALGRTLKKENQNTDHLTVIQGLARVARGSENQETGKEAYRFATSYLFDLLHDWNSGAGKTDPSMVDGKVTHEWYNLITFLFQLHSEFGTETEAQRSFDHLVAPRLPDSIASMSEPTYDALGAILRSAASGGFQRLQVHLYQALALHVTAIQLAVDIDPKLAEAKVAMLGQTDMPDHLQKPLWCLVASKSDDPVGVVERSKGLLHIEDVLTSMMQFESATERVKAAVADSLEEHKRLANVAKSDSKSALEVTKSLREDLEKARAWQREHLEERGNNGSLSYSSEQAIAALDSPFSHGHTLPLDARKFIQ